MNENTAERGLPPEHVHDFACSFGSPTCPAFGRVDHWEQGWRVGPKRWDWLRAFRCLIAGHQWEINRPDTQRVCPRCWLVQDRITPPEETP